MNPEQNNPASAQNFGEAKQNFNQPPAQPNEPAGIPRPQMPQGSGKPAPDGNRGPGRGLIWTLVIVILILLGTAGWFFFGAGNTKPTNSNEFEQARSESKERKLTEISEEWKSYENIEAGFSFPVPEDWEITERQYVQSGETQVYIKSPDFKSEIVNNGGIVEKEKFLSGVIIDIYIKKNPISDTVEKLREFNKAERGLPACVFNEKVIKVEEERTALQYDCKGFYSEDTRGINLQFIVNNSVVGISVIGKDNKVEEVFNSILEFLSTVEEASKAAQLKSRKSAVTSGVRGLQTALDVYKDVYGNYPKSMEEVFEKGIVGRSSYEKTLSAITYEFTGGVDGYRIIVNYPDETSEEFTSSTRPTY